MQCASFSRREISVVIQRICYAFDHDTRTFLFDYSSCRNRHLIVFYSLIYSHIGLWSLQSCKLFVSCMSRGYMPTRGLAGTVHITGSINRSSVNNAIQIVLLLLLLLFRLLFSVACRLDEKHLIVVVNVNVSICTTRHPWIPISRSVRHSTVPCEQKIMFSANAWKRLRWRSGCGQGPRDCSRRTDQQWPAELFVCHDLLLRRL